MKTLYKILTVLISCAFMLNANAQELKQADIKKAEVPPMIDGEIAEWASVDFYEIATITSGDNTKTADDTYGYWQAVWTDTAFIIHVSVTDESMTDGGEDGTGPVDILEIYFGMNNEKATGDGPKTGTATQLAWKWFTVHEFAEGGSGEGDDTLVVWARKDKTDGMGYDLEVSIPWNSMKPDYTPVEGTSKFSFDVNIADIDEGDDAKSDQYWNNWNLGLWKNMANSGDVLLVAGPAGITWPVGVNEIKNNAVNLYPNPASTFVRFNADDVNSVEIYDVTGKMIRSITHLSNKSINLEGMEDGLYILKMNHNSGLQTVSKLYKK
jgi:hypothetical protein